MGKLGNYICDRCGKDCGNPPALNLHQHYCKVKKVAPAPAEEKKCNHDYRLLNPKNPIEEKALKDGYLQVCKKCWGLE